ncbi:MAG: hypothetical protein KF799_05335 [Bdellovibrionales bacterium]|nr:hypothetical protein [Bdellovibrionales bacterium]
MSVFVAGCSTTRLNIDYKKLKSEIPLSGEKVNTGKRLGFVTGEAGGFAWSGCVARAEMSLNELIENAEALGADAVGEIRWDSTGTSEAGCERKWLYVILWPLMATPIFMNTRVEGVAYKRGKNVGMTSQGPAAAIR